MVARTGKKRPSASYRHSVIPLSHEQDQLETGPVGLGMKAHVQNKGPDPLITYYSNSLSPRTLGWYACGSQFRALALDVPVHFRCLCLDQML